jgi:hypothetical protein
MSGGGKEMLSGAYPCGEITDSNQASPQFGPIATILARPVALQMASTQEVQQEQQQLLSKMVEYLCPCAVSHGRT